MEKVSIKECRGHVGRACVRRFYRDQPHGVNHVVEFGLLLLYTQNSACCTHRIKNIKVCEVI